MDKHDSPAQEDEIRFGDLFKPLVQHGKQIWYVALAITLVVAVAAGLYYLFQPTTWSALLGFRPVFDGVDRGLYPNGLAFSPTDIINPSIVDQVYAKNNMSEHCSVDDFRAG